MTHSLNFSSNSELLWLKALSDSLIAPTCFLIAAALIRIPRKRKDIRFSGLVFCMAVFIIACGVAHMMDLLTLWHPVYWVGGSLKACTAVISIVTLILLVRVRPMLLAIPHELADRRFEELIEDAPDANPAGRHAIRKRIASQLHPARSYQLI